MDIEATEYIPLPEGTQSTPIPVEEELPEDIPIFRKRDFRKLPEEFPIVLKRVLFLWIILASIIDALLAMACLFVLPMTIIVFVDNVISTTLWLQWIFLVCIILAIGAGFVLSGIFMWSNYNRRRYEISAALSLIPLVTLTTSETSRSTVMMVLNIMKSCAV